MAASLAAADLAGATGRAGAQPRRLDPAPGHEAAAGLAELTEACRAALELVALDLELVSGLMRRAAAVYGAVERAVAASLLRGAWRAGR